MVKKVTSHSGACSKERRKAIRKKLGTLKNLTVQEKTKERYSASLAAFFRYLREEHLELPTKKDCMDALVSDYLEYLWAQGEGRATASTFMAAVQDFQPKLRHNLPGSWRLMKTWAVHEVPARAPPMTEAVLRAMVGWAVTQGHETFGLSLLLGLYALLRTGELLSIQAWQIHVDSPNQPAVLNLGLTKSGKRQGAAESVTLTEKHVIQHLWAWKIRVPEHTFLTLKPHAWRNLFSECVQKLKLDRWEFRPYSLRRGGATHLFVKGGSLDKVIIAGRWTALKTARIYMNSGLAMLTEIQIPKTLLTPFHRIFDKWNSEPSLEQVLSKNRSGGRGKERKARKNYEKGGGSVVWMVTGNISFMIF
jgi:site-specific recombinase XerD